MVEPDPRAVGLFQFTIITWGTANFVDFPWRHTENQWHALAAEVMLQRTRAEQVVPVFREFSERYTTPLDFLKDPDGIRLFSRLGLLWRARPFLDLAALLSGASAIPSDRKVLLTLPGIGDYIASAFRSLHLGIRDTIIDSNVVRIYGRFFGFRTTPETRRLKAFIELAERITPSEKFRAFNYGLIDFTRAICRPRPRCSECPLQDACRSRSAS